MGQVRAATSRTIAAPPDRVFAALADYAEVRPTLLTEHFSDYAVRTGGVGGGTTVHWKLAATSKRVRDCLIEVGQPTATQLVERDANSSMVTTWTVTGSDATSAVSVETTWSGASGVAGFFERTFAPGGLRRVYDGILANLDRVVRESTPG